MVKECILMRLLDEWNLGNICLPLSDNFDETVIIIKCLNALTKVLNEFLSSKMKV